jgi:putative endonuclease
MAKEFYVYMLASRIGGTLYIGVTSRLVARVAEHRDGVVAGFTKRYRVHRLVWFEAMQPPGMPSAARSR